MSIGRHWSVRACAWLCAAALAGCAAPPRGVDPLDAYPPTAVAPMPPNDAQAALAALGPGINFGNMLNDNWGIGQRLINTQPLIVPTASREK